MQHEVVELRLIDVRRGLTAYCFLTNSEATWKWRSCFRLELARRSSQLVLRYAVCLPYPAHIISTDSECPQLLHYEIRMIPQSTSARAHPASTFAERLVNPARAQDTNLETLSLASPYCPHLREARSPISGRNRRRTTQVPSVWVRTQRSVLGEGW
ncbi:hypothetical protein DAEQUDRAFT_556256 [Daedalea quercina L-15889]|uniref:Uncharacterized protein n=1 Tax=Daedalea quercina L-15889 TaxID=1314783 RepID=A0A165T5J5_9APHY|nr:hypothetical protein DAEQUDRAFT_556256 [Daedalea quercina L-15889]